MTDFRVNMYHTIHSSHALIAATTPSSSTRRPSPSTFFPVLHEEQEQEYSFSEPQHQLYQQSYTPSGSDHRYGVFNSGTTIGLMGCSTTASPPTAVANSTSTMGSSSSSLFSSNHTHSESEESLSTSSRTTNTDAGEEDDEDDDDDEYVDEDEEMEDLGSSIESLTSYYPQLLPDGTTTTTAAAATKNCNMTTTTSSASMALGELERNLVAAVDHWAAAVTQSSSRQHHDGSGSGGGHHRSSGSRYKGSFSRRLLPPTTTYSSSSSSSNSSSYVSLHQHHCSKKTKKTHNAPGTDDQSVCSIASAASSTSAMLGDSFQSTLRVSSPHPSSGHSTGHGVIKSTSQFGGCPPILPHQPQQQQQQTILPPLQSPAVEFQFLVKLRERTYSLCFPVWCPPSSSASSSSSSFSTTLSNPPNVSSGSSCGKRTHPWSSTTTTTMPQGLFSGTTSTSTPATTTTTSTNTSPAATTSMPFLLPTAWQICAALSAKTNIPIHLLQLNDEDIPYSEMQKVLLHPRRRPSSSVHKTSHSHLFQQQQPPTFSGRGVGVGGGGARDDDPCHVFFLNAKLKVHIRGGKGGFGSLLKGQSKQAAAKTTLDFGACRDLSGRRLRHINDEIKLRKWREAIAAKARGETIDEEEHYRTKSGVRNWYLDLPNWALEAFSHKARRADERRVQREMFQKAQEKERQRLEELERKRARDRAIMAYVGPALQPTDSHSMEDAIAQGMMAKRRRTQQQQETTTITNTSSPDGGGKVQASSFKTGSTNSTEEVASPVPVTHTDTTHAATAFNAQDEPKAAESSSTTAGGGETENGNFNLNLTADQAKEIVESTLKEEESWFCTLSGEFATEDTTAASAQINTPSASDGTAPETQNSATSKLSSSSDQPQRTKKWELLVQSKSDFATGCVLLPDDINSVIKDGGLICGKWYYEVKLQETAGMAQIGWANKLFEPNSETGDGVGDDIYSYGYDGSRSLIFHAAASTTAKSTEGETERSYGPTTPWKPFDVIGCMFDADDGHISFSINGKHLGVAYVVDKDTKNNNDKEQKNENQTHQQTKGLFPATSLNQNEIVLVRAGPEFDFLPEGYKGIGEVLRDKIEVPVFTGTTDDEKSERKINGNEIDQQAATNTTRTNEDVLDFHKKSKGQEEVEDSFDVATTINEFQLGTYNSVEELEKLGPDRLKHILISMSVKCGGTLNDRAKRLFSLKGLSRNDYPLKVRAKNFVA